jgi:DNA-binding IclR family transcriptional regulator
LDFDEIVRRIKMDSSKVDSLLSVMEIKGLIQNTNSAFSIPTTS